MPSLAEIIGEHTISLVITGLALEPIQRPISPVDVRFFQVAHQVLPGNISTVIAKLSEKVGIAQPTDKSLGVRQFLFEALVGDQVPGRYVCRLPTEAIEMACVD